MHHLRLHELNITRCPLGLANIFSMFFSTGRGLFTLKCSNEEGRVVELFHLCLKIFCFCFLTVRHIFNWYKSVFVWGYLFEVVKYYVFWKGLKSFQNNHCHKKKITVSWNHFLYVIIPQCGNVCSSERWWGDRRIKTGNVAVQCSHCGLVTVATKTIIFNSVSYM